MKTHIVRLLIGDWSGDGHSKCDNYYITTNYPIEEIQEAYKKTCKEIGLQLHDGEDFTGLEKNSKYGSWRYIATEYEENELSVDVQKILIQHGCHINGKPLQLEERNIIGSEDMLYLFMWFVTYSMPLDFTFEPLQAEIINEISDFTFQIGYGCFE